MMGRCTGQFKVNENGIELESKFISLSLAAEESRQLPIQSKTREEKEAPVAARPAASKQIESLGSMKITSNNNIVRMNRENQEEKSFTR